MLAIGCDHGGYELKQEILKHLDERNIAYKDFGCDSTASVDYPVYAKKVCNAILSGECEMGILICGTGIGISITANKFRESVRLSAQTASVRKPPDSTTMPTCLLWAAG